MYIWMYTTIKMKVVLTLKTNIFVCSYFLKIVRSPMDIKLVFYFYYKSPTFPTSFLPQVAILPANKKTRFSTFYSFVFKKYV